ncbi:MAG: DUF2935 domain-containing protein [Bacilli bacterium]
MNNSEYIRLSLELHLFFDRIMKEHSFFLEVAFLEKDNNLKKIAKDFKNLFSNTLEEVISLANNNVSPSLLTAEEIVTKNTLEAENKTSKLSGSYINTNITMKELNLRSGNINVNNELLSRVSNLNKRTLLSVSNLINFKNDILNKVLSCQMFTSNYPLLIKHIMNEAKMYHSLLSKIENRTVMSKNDIYNEEIFWNNIMMEHALFIRGLLDPSEDKLISVADKYAKEYKVILNNTNVNPNYLTSTSLKETINFRDFKVTGEEGILNCKVKSIIIPLLADHVVREANHFIRILKSYPNN